MYQVQLIFIQSDAFSVEILSIRFLQTTSSTRIGRSEARFVVQKSFQLLLDLPKVCLFYEVTLPMPTQGVLQVPT
jgi:hypothetical protein